MLSQLQAQSLKAGHNFFSSEWAAFAYGHAPVEGSSPQQRPSSPWHPMGLSSQPLPDSCPGREWQDLCCTPTHARDVVQLHATTVQPEPGAGGEGRELAPVGSQTIW